MIRKLMGKGAGSGGLDLEDCGSHNAMFSPGRQKETSEVEKQPTSSLIWKQRQESDRLV